MSPFHKDARMIRYGDGWGVQTYCWTDDSWILENVDDEPLSYDKALAFLNVIREAERSVEEIYQLNPKMRPNALQAWLDAKK